MAKPKFLDEHGTVGANAAAGAAFTECPWHFGGYAIPLLDPLENHARFTAIAPFCEPAWSPFTDYHVRTTNTCTLLLSEHERWRVYIQDPVLTSDYPEGSVPVESDADTTAFPSTYSGGGTIRRYPTDAAWAAESHFLPDYISFVDSPDGGLTFPIYAPVVSIGKFNKGGSTPGCADSVEPVVTDPNFTNAGWTPTCLPCRTITPDTDGVYSVYRNVSVLDLFEEWGFYLMFAVECRSDYEYELGEACHPCGFGSTNRCGVHTMPYTRYVVFLSMSPDFAGGNISHMGTFPDPLLHSLAVAVVQPDAGVSGPASGDAPNEFYGVSRALLTPDHSEILVYAGWTSLYSSAELVVDPFGAEVSVPFTATGSDPSRMTNFYRTGKASHPGLSAFRFDTDEFMLGMMNITWTDFISSDAAVRASVRAAFADRANDAYQGEVLVATESLSIWSGLWECQTLNPRDAAFVYCGGCDNQLHVYWDQAVGDSFSNAPMVQLDRAASATWDDLPPFMRPAAEQLNGPDTIFILPSECPVVLDMSASLGLSDTRTIVMDPDVAVLGSGRLRVSFNQGALEWGPGLVCAFGPPESCEALSVPEWRGFPGPPPPPPPPPPANLPTPIRTLPRANRVNPTPADPHAAMVDHALALFNDTPRPATRSRQDHALLALAAASDAFGVALPRNDNGALLNPFTGAEIHDTLGCAPESDHPVVRFQARLAAKNARVRRPAAG